MSVFLVPFSVKGLRRILGNLLDYVELHLVFVRTFNESSLSFTDIRIIADISLLFYTVTIEPEKGNPDGIGGRGEGFYCATTAIRSRSSFNSGHRL